MNQTMRPVIRGYIAFQFFFNLLLWVPVFYEVQKRFGLSDPEIFGIQSIYYIAFCFMEVPTGLIADRLGYRLSMQLGALTLIVANILPLSVAAYPGFLSHFLAVALARSLISGAASAYLYEYLRGHGAADGYKKIEGDARFYALVGRVVAWAAVGYLMAWQISSPYWLSALNAGVALVIALRLPNVAAKPGHVAKTPLPVAITSVLKSRHLLHLMVQGVGIFVLVRVVQVNLYQPILRDKGYSLEAFGWIMSLMTVAEAVGSKVSHRVRRLIPDIAAVTVATLVLCLCLAVVATFGQTGTLFGLSLFSLAAGIAFPVQKQVMNDAISDHRLRATVLSLESILDRAVCALAVLPLGGLVANGQLNAALLGVGGITALVAVIGSRVHLGRAKFAQEALCVK